MCFRGVWLSLLCINRLYLLYEGGLHMKKRQIFAWGTFLLTFVFMIAAVKNFQDDQDEPFLNTFPFHFSIDWYMTSLNGAGARPQDMIIFWKQLKMQLQQETVKK